MEPGEVHKISPGCKNCYGANGQETRGDGAAELRERLSLTVHPHVVDAPPSWKAPRVIFVNSMSDLFHEDVPLAFIQKVFDVMKRADWHQFQILTKRSGRLLQLDSSLEWAGNVWMGVSVETERYQHRIDDLRQTSAAVKFLSLEPLLGALPALDLTGIDWVIVGGESGPRARPMNEEWVLEIRDQCVDQGVPFFFKQWGGTNKKKAGRILQGRTWDEMPVSGRMREATRVYLLTRKPSWRRNYT